ncbi:MAG: alpha/beta fold hydrolase, partial [Chloroflexota bacterium]|nr:alpha/beta fold hydrolase [Chloroflexota bacterium]
MALDVELYRRTVYLPEGQQSNKVRRISVIDIHPEGATRTLVCIHGYGGDAHQWLYQLRFFGQTMRVIAPDMRGHGLSDDISSLPYSITGLIDDLEYVLNALDVQQPFVLVAHSFGGAIATEYTLRHPESVSQLVLIGVPIRFNLSPLLRRALLIPDPIFSRVAKIIHVALFASQRTLKRMHDRIMSIWQGSELMHQLRVPTLVVMGQRDRVFRREDYSEVPRCIPNAQQVVIPVSSHLVQLERSDAVNRAIRRFIEPKPQDPKEARQQNIARSSAAAARYAEMPWLQHYDVDVPEQLPQPRQLIHEMLSNAAREFPDRPALSFFGQKMRYREL